MELDLRWLPRRQNIEADALTKREFEGFDPKLRIGVDMDKVDFLILNKLMEKAEACEALRRS